MADHKAPTQVTIASTTEETALHLFIERYWKMGALLAVVVAAAILWRGHSERQDLDAMRASWDRLRSGADFSFGVSATGTASELQTLASELRDTEAGPWAKALEVRKRIDEDDYSGARLALDEMEAAFPDHPLVTESIRLDEDGPSQTLAAHLRERMGAMESWESEARWLFENPPPADDAPRVQINTSAGQITVALYTEQAPNHCENFLKHCREGFYDNTKFHRVIPDFMIQGGDPNSIEGPPETWGQGGVDYTQPQEFSELRHFPYVLAAAKRPTEVESGGAQFYITTGEPHHLDGVHTIFGAVVSGELIVDAIEQLPTTGDRPDNPVSITSTVVVE